MSDDIQTAIAEATTALQSAGLAMTKIAEAAQAEATANSDLTAALAKANEDNAALQQQLADAQAQSSNPWYALDRTGLTDVTSAVASLLAAGGSHVVPAGTYMIDPTKSIFLSKAGTKLDYSAAKFKLKSNSAARYAGLVAKAPDCEIIHGEIIGDRDSHVFDDSTSTDEWGHCFLITKGADRLKSIGGRFSNGTGDGIKAEGGVRGVVIEDAICINNRRQGLSITHVYDLTVRRGTYQDTNGTKPQAGIDIEPNAGEEALNVRIEGVISKGNAFGINIQNARVNGVDIVDCDVSGNRSVGIANQAGLNVRITGTTPGAMKVSENGKTGIHLYPNTKTTVGGVAFRLNYATQDPKLRATPLITDKYPSNVVKDLLVGKGATITIPAVNSFA